MTTQGQRKRTKEPKVQSDQIVHQILEQRDIKVIPQSQTSLYKFKHDNHIFKPIKNIINKKQGHHDQIPFENDRSSIHIPMFGHLKQTKKC